MNREFITVISTPHGGHGSVFISKRINLCVRPDTVFGEEIDIEARPTPDKNEAYYKRCGVYLRNDWTIEKNLVQLWDCGRVVLLSGRHSVRLPFLTRNKLKAICILRNPINSYVSYTKRQHPEHVRRFGGYNTKEAVNWWCDLWNHIVSDYVTSGSPIYFFEKMPETLPWPYVNWLRGWDKTKGEFTYKELDIKLIRLLIANIKGTLYNVPGGSATVQTLSRYEERK